MLMFFPLARCNFLAWMVGSDFPELVKYHRWGPVGADLAAWCAPWRV